MAEKASTGYEDYARVAASYDTTRRTYGLEIILGALARYAGDKPLSSLRILDAGCGTGNFELELYRYLGHIVAFDSSDEMLACAEKKLSGISNVTLKKANLLETLPFESDSYDAVLMIYVSHHLDQPREDGTNMGENLKSAVKECCRVLKKRAPLIICTNTKQQSLRSIWYFYFACQNGFSDILRSHMGRYLPLDELTSLCEESGFNSGPRLVPVNEMLIKPEFYYDVNLVLVPECRMSAWTSIEKEDRYVQFMEAFKAAADKNEMEKWMRESDEIRLREGTSTFLIFYKK